MSIADYVVVCALHTESKNSNWNLGGFSDKSRSYFLISSLRNAKGGSCCSYSLDTCTIRTPSDMNRMKHVEDGTDGALSIIIKGLTLALEIHCHRPMRMEYRAVSHNRRPFLRHWLAAQRRQNLQVIRSQQICSEDRIVLGGRRTPRKW